MALLMASYDKDFSPPSLLESTAASVGLRLTVKKLEDGVGVERAMPNGGGDCTLCIFARNGAAFCLLLWPHLPQ